MNKNKELYVDLHVHTNLSDGSFEPAEAVRYAHKVGLAAISITDHDSVNGIDAAISEGSKIGLEVIPGIELSTEVNDSGKSEMHILGYYIDWQNEELRQILKFLQDERNQRAYKIIDKFAALGIKIDKDKLTAMIGNGGTIGRLHFAKMLIEMDIVDNVSEAFYKYLGEGRSAYVPKHKISPDEGIQLILRFGGIPVLAHPYYAHYSNNELLIRLVKNGLKGIEVWHTKHPQSAIGTFEKLAKKHGLISTGGSDCHGAYGGESALLGTIKVPYSVVEELKKLKKGS